jgi:histidinol-phosphate aminotransferase
MQMQLFNEKKKKEGSELKGYKKQINPSLRIQNYLNLKNSAIKPVDEIHSEEMIYLDKNENPFSPTFGALSLIDFQKLVTKYPDPNCKKFLNQLTEKIGYPVSFVIAGAGSDELLDMIFRTFIDSKDIVLSVEPSFSMYKKYAEINGAIYLSYPLNLKIDNSTGIASYNLNKTKFLKQARIARILILARPNNPDGSVVSKEFVEQLLNLNKLTIIDEAYIEFSNISNLLDLLNKYKNLVILRTLSKSHALAGIRLGYAVANPYIIEVLKKIKSPYNVNSFAAHLGSMMIRSNEILENIRKIKATREEVVQKLLYLRDKSKQFFIHISQGNFILIRFLNPAIATSVYHFLLKSQIKVRKFDDDLPDCIRVSIGTNCQMNLLLEKLETYFRVK